MLLNAGKLIKYVALRLFTSHGSHFCCSFTSLNLPRSTRKALEAEREIFITSIEYIQVGTEDLSEAHAAMEEPLKTMSGDPRSLFISAGESSVRIRLRDDETATELAERLRSMTDEEPVAEVPTEEEST